MSKKTLILTTYVILAAASILAFRQLNHSNFINYDDPTYVTENPHIQNGITAGSIRWAFTTGYAANWHPLTWMSHMLDVELFGFEPRWHHLVSLLFHVANALLLFFVFYRMTKAHWQSAFVAALFALHPLHVESVAWVAERKDVLSTFFWMLTMAAYIRHVEHPDIKGRLAVPALFALGLMAKPMLVTLPFVLLLLDYWPLHRIKPDAGAKNRWTSIRPLIFEKVPLFAMAAASSIVTFIVQQKGGSVVSLDEIQPGIRVANAFVSYVAYIEKIVWPHGLAVFYPHPRSWPFWQVCGAVFLLAAVSLVVIRAAKRFPYLGVGWFWFTGTLVPVIGIVQVGNQGMADRYTYIPSIGLFVMAAWGIPELFRKYRRRGHALAALSAAVPAALLIATWTQVGYWHDGITLYDHALAVTSRNDKIYNNRGDAWCRAGDLRRAIPDFDRAVAINPRNSEAYYNRGVTFGKLGDPGRAIEDFSSAIAIDPERPEPYFNRGFARDELRDFQGAISDYDRAIELSPRNARAYNSRGIAYGRLGEYSRAVSDYDMAVRIDPGFASAFNNRGFAYGRLGNFGRAVDDYDRAVAIDPGYAKAFFNRAVAFGELGQKPRAIEDLRKAAGLGSEEAGAALRNLGLENRR